MTGGHPALTMVLLHPRFHRAEISTTWQWWYCTQVMSGSRQAEGTVSGQATFLLLFTRLKFSPPGNSGIVPGQGLGTG
jgi:hypothetical protein